MKQAGETNSVLKRISYKSKAAIFIVIITPGGGGGGAEENVFLAKYSTYQPKENFFLYPTSAVI